MNDNDKTAEYIDVDSALKRVGGNMGLFKRLLGRYIEGQNFAALESTILSGDLEEAARLAHTLKGVSSNLSLIKVASLSATLEQQLKNGEDYSICLSQLKQACDVTEAKIAELNN